MTDTLARDGAASEYAIGGRPLRRETERFVQGAGEYVDDVRLPGTLYAAFVRATVAHARIRGVDTSAARALPGVVAVVTAADLADEMARLPGTGGPIVAALRFHALAESKVRYVGEAVAVAVADSRYSAQDAADAVVVDYEPLPVIADAEQALGPDAAVLFEELPSGNLVQEVHFATEGVEEAFAAADHVIRERFRSHRWTPCPMEGRGVLAEWDSLLGVLTVWSSSAGAHAVRGRVAAALRMPENHIRVIIPDVGGSFGAKNGTYPEELIIPYLARKLGRPVKWAETRSEHLATVRQGRDQTHDVEVAVRADGRILAIRDRITADLGAAAYIDNALMSTVLYMTGAYDVQTYAVDAYGAATNKAPHGSLRGIGKADAAFVVERLVDMIARQVGRDPAEVRLLNFVPAEAFPYRTATGAILDSGQYHAALRRALELADYDELRREQAARPAGRVRRGIGTSLVIEPTGAGRRGAGGGFGACRLRMEPSGRVSLFPSHAQQGQGHVTTFTQIIADRLGVAPTTIDVFPVDTNNAPFGTGAGSSRSSVVLMPAVYVAADRLRDKVLRIAAHNLEVAPADLVLDGDTVRPRDGAGGSLSLRDVTRIAYNDVYLLPPDMDPGLEVLGYFTNPNIVYEPDERGRHNEFAAYPYEAVVAAVDVDLDTGAVEIVKYVSVHDCGTMLNPRIVETQHVGCIAQGIGGALFEELGYDEDGRLNSTFMDYLLPTVNDLPALTLDHLETPTPFTPLGAKGAGETGTLSPPCALGNAIEDALAPLGVQIRATPYTRDRIWRLIHAAETDQGDA
ncbi:MAG TPA: xanthine dehydrogenase family protein molybdopterin-binding subunit [Chloroflexota bacterium]